MHKLVSRGLSLKPGTPKRVSQIVANQVPITCGEGEDAFESALQLELPKAYKLRGKNLDVSARFKAARSYRDDLTGRQLRVVMHGTLTRRGNRAKGTVQVVARSTSGGNVCRTKARWSARPRN